MSHVEMMKQVQKMCRMYWKYQAFGFYKLLVCIFVFLEFCSYLQTFTLYFYMCFIFLHFFQKCKSYILNAQNISLPSGELT